MVFDRKIFYIEEGSLAKALKLEQRNFDEIVNFLVASLEENIRIQEKLHFVIQGYIGKKQPVRIFSREGAIAIAKYLDIHGQVNELALKTVLALIERYHLNQIDAKVRQAVYENSSSLTLRNQRHWLSRDDVIKIFKTNSSRLDIAFQNIQRSDFPMRINEDFETQENSAYFSLSGLEKLSIELSLNLLSEERREYCKRVREVAPPVLEFLAFVPLPSQQDIDRAIHYAKNRDGSCQITGVIRNKYENRLIKLVGHHLYDKNTYNFLGADPDNILTIAEQVSEDFHQWNGGNQKTCTIDDFIDYVEWRYPQKHNVILMLHNRRRILLLKLTQLQRALPEGE
ncbi:hypothetical protein LC593_00980 [Nostoc sp. CHAB 5844]|nr:hypothetical protein [Nostoc sp. CHAB 5844]